MEFEELYNKVKEWLPTQLYVDMSKIQRKFNVGFSRAYKVVQLLIQDQLIEEKFIVSKGHKVYHFETKEK